MSEFNEPWTAIHLDDKLAEIYGSGHKMLDGHAIPVSEAERIVACVNFCRNMDTGTLQFYGAPLPDEKPDRCPARVWAQSVSHD